MATLDRDLARGFAGLLAYPGPELAPAARACAAALGPRHPDAARLLEAFAAFVESTPPGRVEEVYSGLFELDAATPPYVGYHLFGESYKRSAFLLRLRAACRSDGVDPGPELADHLAVVLALLAASRDEELRQELAEDALVPALERMVGPVGDPRGPEDGRAGEHAAGRAAYLGVLRALALVLAPPVAAEGRS
jgi:nitrate reductase delta subunit